MKKTIIAIILLVLGSLITSIEVERIERMKGEDSVFVVVANAELKMGDVIQSKDVVLKQIPKGLNTMHYYQSVDEVMDKTLKVDLMKDIVINTQMVSSKQIYDPSEGKAITAIKFLPEEILCWEVSMGDAILLVSVSQEGFVVDIGSVTVKGVYYQNSHQEGKYENTPVYLLVEGSKEQIKTIIKHRLNGKIEGIKVGS